MKKYWQYLLYVIKHKFYVYREGRKLNVNIWQLLIHDFSKFTPIEFVAYSNFFYGEKTSINKEKFRIAWHHHLHNNKHHWQYWILRNDDGTTFALPMPDKYIREMVADWSGVAYALNAPPAKSWYDVNKQKMLLHETTKISVERYLENL